MGFMDKIKGAVNAVTGGAAKVTLDVEPRSASPGDTVKVKVTATSSGAEVKSKGVYVDLAGEESVRLPKGTVANVTEVITASKTTFSQEVKLAGDFVLKANETKAWEGTVPSPREVKPSYAGAFTNHEWNIRGLIEAFGNDPDSGFQSIRVGPKG